MKSRKLSVILIAIAFLIVVVFSCVFTFSVQEVRVNFAATADFDSDSVMESLEKFNGRNLIFFNLDEIKTELASNPKCEVVSADKSYPNVLNVSIKERVARFKITYQEKTYSLSEDGYVLEEISDPTDKLLHITLNGVNVTGVKLGEKIATENDELFSSILSTAKAISFTDNATEITLNAIPYSFNEAVVFMRSGVQIKIWVDTDEVFTKDLIEKAFAAYNGELLNADGKRMSDYEKFTSSIIVTKSDDGKIQVTWSEE